MNRESVRRICKLAADRLRTVHINCFKDMSEPLLLISEQYPGLWLEHIYDSVIYASMEPEYIFLAKNAVNAFIDRQTEEGQLPFAIWDGNRIPDGKTEAYYWQIQECVSFYSLCLDVYRMDPSEAFLKKIYESGLRWISWLRKYRMTTDRGLIEMFYGYDCGHDNSGRLTGFSHPGNYSKDGVIQNAGVCPPADGVTPLLAVDMNANFYGNLRSLAEMAQLLGRLEEAHDLQCSAAQIKKLIFAYLWNEEDAFFYDVDVNGIQRKYRSCTIFHLFLERVLDPVADAEKIRRIYSEHIKNPAEFWTAYPFPSMAINDPSCEGHPNYNCWGYYTQGLTVLRCTRWMDAYGWQADMDLVCEKWLEAWTTHFDTIHLAQELDPISGIPTKSSQWYSSCMLGYLWAARRLDV